MKQRVVIFTTITIVFLASLIVATASTSSSFVDVPEGEYYIVSKEFGIGKDHFLGIEGAKDSMWPILKTLGLGSLTGITTAALFLVTGATPWHFLFLFSEEYVSLLLLPVLLGILTIHTALNIPMGHGLIISTDRPNTWRISASPFAHFKAFELANSWDKTPQRKGMTVALTDKHKLVIHKDRALPFRAERVAEFPNFVHLEALGQLETENKYMYLEPKAKQGQFKVALNKSRASLWELRPIHALGKLD